MKINEDETEGCKRIRGMSLLLQGDCNEVLVENLGNCPSLASLVNWFSNGFGIPDIIRCIQYLNTFWNLEWLITNMSQETLIGYGFEGRFLNPSKKFFGKLVKSSSGRTLYLHHLQRRSEFDGGKDICSKAEAIVVGASLLEPINPWHLLVCNQTNMQKIKRPHSLLEVRGRVESTKRKTLNARSSRCGALRRM